MKKIIAVFCLCFIIFLNIVPMAVYAISPIDPAKESSLTFQYKYSGTVFKGLEIKTYRIAEVFENGTYALTETFKGYPVNIYDVTSQTEWQIISATLDAYIAADDIECTASQVTDETGTVVFDKLLPGMYLTLSANGNTDEGVAIFETFLTVVPYPNENGEHNYNVTAYPKCESYIPDRDEIEYKIVKQWKDNGYEKRPASVEVDILKNGELFSTQILSAENNWSYNWKTEDDGSKWQAVERKIAQDYTVTVSQNGNTIIITNVYDEFEEPPLTGESTGIWPYVIVMCISGGVITVLATWRKRAG